MSHTDLIVTLTQSLSPDGEEIETLPSAVSHLEVRADLIGDVDSDWIRQRFPGRLIYTLRSVAEGGRFEGDRASRRKRILAQGARYDLVDLEAERDLGKEILEGIPPEKRIISWHGSVQDLGQLRGRFEKMSREEARLYKLIPEAFHSGEEIKSLALLYHLRRKDVVAFSSGSVGAWTRFTAPLLGAPIVYAALGETPGAPGQPSVKKVLRDLPFPDLPEVHELLGVVGDPVAHSLSPRIHNAACRALGLPYLYLPFHVERFGDFWLDVVEAGSLEVLGFPLRGLSITAPHKEVALAVAGATSPLAERIGAANTLVRREGVWEAESTDPEGVVEALSRREIDVKGHRAAVVGAGGAGRAAALGLELSGATVTLVNRSETRGQRAAQELGVKFEPLDRFTPRGYDILVHATPLGRDPAGAMPFSLEGMEDGAVVLDLVYGDSPTPLLQEASQRGAVTVDGREVLLHQARRQFFLMTGQEPPMDTMSHALGLEG